jgi:hypothetical protein
MIGRRPRLPGTTDLSISAAHVCLLVERSLDADRYDNPLIYLDIERAHCLTRNVTGELPPMIGTAPPNRLGGVFSAVAERNRSAGPVEKGRMLDALCRTTGWHRKHAVRALRRHETVGPGVITWRGYLLVPTSPSR